MHRPLPPRLRRGLGRHRASATSASGPSTSPTRRSPSPSCMLLGDRALPGARPDGVDARRRRMPDGAVAAGDRGRCACPTGRRAGSTGSWPTRPGLSRSYVQKLISDGRLTADGQADPGQHDRRSRRGAAARRPGGRARSTSSPAPDIQVDVVYEDDDLLIVDKPAGLVVHPVARATPTTRSSTRCSARADGVGVRRHRRGRAAGHRPSPRPRHERPADGREARRARRRR